MGGHGGLNILPQKSWNVYGQRNRLKVAEDEAEQARKDVEQQRKRQKRDNEARLKNLRGAQGHDGEAQEGVDHDHDHDQHVNFWADFEEEGHNLEALEEAKAEARKRGNAKTQTSDARFDASFEVLHGLKGPAPWYARAPTQLAPDGAGTAHMGSCSSHAGQPRGKRDRQANGPALVRVASLSSEHGKPEKEAKRSDRHSRRKDSKHSGVKKTSTKKEPSLVSKVDIAKLREERLAREKAESARSRTLLRRNLT